MIKIKIKSWWASDDIMLDRYNRLTKDNNRIWKNIYLTDKDDYDYLIIQGSTNDPVDPCKCIVLQYEPKSYRLKNYNYNFIRNNGFYKFIDIENYLPIDHWSIDMTYKQIELEYLKTRVFSGLISDKYELEGQIDRFDFVVKYLNNIEYYDSCTTRQLWKHTTKKLNCIPDAYTSYKYTFNAENSYEKNYFTEKLIRPILFNCLCFYSGCSNVDKFIDPRCYIKLNLKNPEECVKIIKKSIQDNEHKKRLPCIRRQKYLLMNDNNPLNLIKNIIETGDPMWISTN